MSNLYLPDCAAYYKEDESTLRTDVGAAPAGPPRQKVKSRSYKLSTRMQIHWKISFIAPGYLLKDQEKIISKVTELKIRKLQSFWASW